MWFENKNKNVHNVQNAKTKKFSTGVCPYKKISKMSISVSCKHKERVFSCIGNLFVGTKATISCHTGYVHTTDNKNPELICLDSGQWSHKAHRCEPVCGLMITEILLFSFNYIHFLQFPSNFRRRHKYNWRSMACGHLLGWWAGLWWHNHHWAPSDQRRSLFHQKYR